MHACTCTNPVELIRELGCAIQSQYKNQLFLLALAVNSVKIKFRNNSVYNSIRGNRNKFNERSARHILKTTKYI